jgi:hypothetical protein
MRVTIISINEGQAVLVRGTSALGVVGSFGCPLVVGDAVFVASRGFEDNLRGGTTIEVEAGYESLSDIECVSADEVSETIEPCGEPCDYLVHSRVISVQSGIVRVSVRALYLNIEREHLGGLTPEEQGGVRFKLHRLHFWDTAT